MPGLKRGLPIEQAMRIEVVEEGGVLSSIWPEGHRSFALAEKCSDDTARGFVPGLGHSILLW
jgi:hypothetical protein